MHGTRAVLDYKPSAPAITGKAPMDSRDIAGEIIRRQQQLEADRAIYESLWQEIADLMLPRAGVFTQKGTPQLRPQVFDSTAVLALDRFSAAFESMLTPRSQTWHMLKPLEDDLAEDPRSSAGATRSRSGCSHSAIRRGPISAARFMRSTAASAPSVPARSSPRRIPGRASPIAPAISPASMWSRITRAVSAMRALQAGPDGRAGGAALRRGQPARPDQDQAPGAAGRQGHLHPLRPAERSSAPTGSRAGRHGL
jgi:hypothetical protein